MARGIKVELPDIDEVRFAIRISRALLEKGGRGYIVGGPVRDMLMGRTPKDWDMCATRPPDEVKNLGFKAVPTGEQYGTITLIEGDSKIEVTTTRLDHGHGENRRDVKPVFTFDNEMGPQWDVQRRDLTINGLLCDPLTGEVLDYVGGIQDLQNGVIRFIGDPEKRVIEDGLRLLRWVRFICSTGMSPDPVGFDLVFNPTVQNRLENLSGERIRDELLGILSTERAALGITFLQELGILDTWIPELAQLFDMEQNVWHSECVGGHTLMSLDNVVRMGGDLTDRVTALFHDLGKGVTQDVKSMGLDSDSDRERQLAEYGYSFHGHDAESVRILDESVCPRLKLYGPTDKYDVDMDRVKHLIGCHMHTFSSNKMRMSRRLKHTGVSDFDMDMMDRSFMLFLADTLGRELWLDYPLGRAEAEPMWAVVERGADIRKKVLTYLEQERSARTVKDVLLNGHDVMRLLEIKPSRTVGKVLNHLFDLVTSEGIENDPAVLEQYVRNNQETLLNLPDE
jgi:tRNA nucleotidyltransferase (CCA-adding enzyme)